MTNSHDIAGFQQWLATIGLKDAARKHQADQRQVALFATVCDDHSGAVSIDWVVLTGALTGLSIAIALSFSDAIQGPTGALLSSMRSVSALTFDDADQVSASTAQSFFDLGIGAYPDSRTDAWRAARDAVAAEAPEGYNYDPDYNETRYIDVASGTPIYESDYGTSYSINGQTIEASDYNTAGRISFQAGFNQYWNDTQ